MDKLKLLAILFAIFQLSDFAVSYIGISTKGISFERNAFAVYFVENFGVFSLLLFKMTLSSLVLFTAFKYNNKQFLFVYILITILALYGLLSAIYGLLFI